MRRFYISVITCLLTVGVLAGNSLVCSAADQFMALKDKQAFRKELAEKNQSVHSIRAKFFQDKYLDVFSKTVKSEGCFLWQSPDKICLDYSSPTKYKIVINGDKLKTETGGRSSVVSAKGNPMMDQMSNLISACMTGNLDALGSDFRYEVRESASQYLVTIEPVSQMVKKYIAKMEIRLDRRDMSVVKLVMFENATDYTSYTFTEKKFNETIPSAVFSIR